ncbi:MAG: hypothetical protein F6K63_05475 [Moorea sp. SIO1G6]|uniref:hypothetical protein n=1 Tax=Moorena sp. SIO1G6 TaxID=2607840 RepID=UPI0013C159F1|nr:hypothetical protein [Moorena sp. SIO1G6]NET63884.1 hypothetical protein [Moorena sp. SIO1G6]
MSLCPPYYKSDRTTTRAIALKAAHFFHESDRIAIYLEYTTFSGELSNDIYQP